MVYMDWRGDYICGGVALLALDNIYPTLFMKSWDSKIVICVLLQVLYTFS